MCLFFKPLNEVTFAPCPSISVGLLRLRVLVGEVPPASLPSLVKPRSLLRTLIWQMGACCKTSRISSALYVWD